MLSLAVSNKSSSSLTEALKQFVENLYYLQTEAQAEQDVRERLQSGNPIKHSHKKTASSALSNGRHHSMDLQLRFAFYPGNQNQLVSYNCSSQSALFVLLLPTHAIEP